MFKFKVLLIIPVLLISLFYNPIWNYDWAIQFYPLVFQAAASITFLIALCLTQNKIAAFKPTLLDYLALAYYGYAVGVSVWNNNNLKYDTEIATMFAYLLLFLSIRLLVSDDADNIVLFRVLLVFAVLNCLIGSLQAIRYLPIASRSYNLTGTFYNPGPFGGYVAMLLPLGFQFVLRTGSSKWKAFYVALFIFMAGCVILSGSRAALLASLVSIALMTAFHFRNLLGAYKVWILTGGIVLLIACIFALYHVRPASADGRLLIWKVSSRMIDRSTILGNGVGHFNDEYNLYQSKYMCSQATLDEKLLAGYVHSPFNDFIKVLFEFGVIGLLLLLTIVWKVFSKLQREKLGLTSLAGISSLLSFFVFSFYSYPMQITALHTLFCIMIAVNCSGTKSFSEKKVRVKSSILVLIFFLNAVFLYRVYNGYKAISNWRSASLAVTYNLAYALRTYENVYPDLINSYTFLYNYGSELADLGYYKKAISVYEKLNNFHHDIHLYSQMGRCYESLKLYDLAEKNYQIASCMEPIRLNPQLLLFKLFESSGQHKKAISQAQNILNTPVKIKTTEAEEIRKEMRFYLLDHEN